MNMKLKATASAMVLALVAGAAMAQTDVTAATDLNQALDDQDRAIAIDMARSNDAARFGNPETKQGMSGSASLSYSGVSGGSDTQDFTAGARLRYATGKLVQTIGASMTYSDANGVKSQDKVFAVYDANYYFTDKVYGFVLGNIKSDRIANTKEAFLGFGPGYRILNSENVTWRVQAGVGIDYDDVNDKAAGAIVSSRFFYAFNPNLFATMDTDVIKTKYKDKVNNEISMNVKMTDAFSTRVSYLTEYSKGTTSTNTFGVSLVYGF